MTKVTNFQLAKIRFFLEYIIQIVRDFGENLAYLVLMDKALGVGGAVGLLEADEIDASRWRGEGDRGFALGVGAAGEQLTGGAIDIVGARLLRLDALASLDAEGDELGVLGLLMVLAVGDEELTRRDGVVVAFAGEEHLDDVA